MPADLDQVLWGLDDEADEPSVLVDPALEAFCLMRTRMARGTSPPRTSSADRPTLEAIIQYMSQNADRSDR